MARAEPPVAPEVLPGAPDPAVPWGPRLATALGIDEAGRVLRDFASYLPSQLLPALAGFLVLPFLTRELTPTELGVATIDQMLMLLAPIVAASWFTAAIVRELPAAAQRDGYGGERRTLRAGLLISLGGLVAFSALLALVGVFSAAIGQELAPIVLGSFGFFFLNIASAIFNATLRPRAYATIQLLARVGGVALGIALVYEDHGVRGYLLGVGGVPLAVGAVALLAAWLGLGRSGAGAGAGANAVSGWLRFGLPVAASAVMFWGLASFDRYLLALLRHAGETGVYSLGNSLGYQAVNIPLFAFLIGATPLLMTAFEQSGRREVERLMRAYTRVMLLLAAPIVALSAAVSGELVDAITGGRTDYDGAAPVIPLVGVAALLTSLGSLGGAPLATARRTRYLVVGSGTGFGVSVAADLILIPLFGVMGAAVAAPIGAAAYLAVTYAYARRFARWQFPVDTCVRAVLASGVAYLLARVATAGGLSAAASIGVGLVVGAVAYGVALLVLGERKAARRDAARVASDP